MSVAKVIVLRHPRKRRGEAYVGEGEDGGGLLRHWGGVCFVRLPGDGSLEARSWELGLRGAPARTASACAGLRGRRCGGTGRRDLPPPLSLLFRAWPG